MDCLSRYVKWQSSYGLAYAHIPHNYAYPYINGATLENGIVSVSVSDAGLINVSKEEFDAHMDKWRALMDVRLTKSECG